MIIQPYLFFDGRCEEAVSYYQEHLGAKVVMSMRFKDSPEEANCGPDGKKPDPEKIMHTGFMLGESLIMPPMAIARARPSSTASPCPFPLRKKLRRSGFSACSVMAARSVLPWCKPSSRLPSAWSSIASASRGW